MTSRSPYPSHLKTARRTAMQYVVLLFERGPLYFYFDCYLAGPKWIVSALQYNGKPESILPQSMLGS